MSEVGYSRITARVSQALETDPRTADYAIEVIDNNGLVTIEGIVPSKEVKEAAEEITREQEGVISVTNALVVDVDDQATDRAFDEEEADEGLDEDEDRDVLVTPPATEAKTTGTPPTRPV